MFANIYITTINVKKTFNICNYSDIVSTLHFFLSSFIKHKMQSKNQLSLCFVEPIQTCHHPVIGSMKDTTKYLFWRKDALVKIYENLRGKISILQKVSNDLNYFDNTLELKTYQFFCNSSVSQLYMTVVCEVELFHGVIMRAKGGVW